MGSITQSHKVPHSYIICVVLGWWSLMTNTTTRLSNSAGTSSAPLVPSSCARPSCSRTPPTVTNSRASTIPSISPWWCSTSPKFIPKNSIRWWGCGSSSTRIRRHQSSTSTIDWPTSKSQPSWPGTSTTGWSPSSWKHSNPHITNIGCR